MPVFRLYSPQFRAIPAPVGDSRVGLFFTPASGVPQDLWDWRNVNPREINRRSSVYKQMKQTLTESSAQFHERNRGITIVAKELSYDEKKKEVLLTLDDDALHGVVDGAHTLDAILETQKNPPESGWPAHVFIKAVVGVDPDQIAEIAGGLNTSQQVDLKSLENLRDHFSELQKALSQETYADLIAYKMNDNKPIDVREVLYYLSVFDCSRYSDNRHPVALFGRKEGIVRTFADQAAEKDGSGDSFNVLISKAAEILWLRDYLEREALKQKSVGRYKAGRNTRIRSESNKQNHLLFIDEQVNGRIPLGWIMPMLAAFRANVEWGKPKGSFRWKMPIKDLVDACIESLVLGVQDVHEQENHRPEYVGRNSIAWRMSYNTVAQAILQWELTNARKKN